MANLSQQHEATLATYGLLGGNGSYRIDDTTAYSGKFKVILVVAQAVIASLTEAGISNALTKHNISAKTLAAGEVIVAENEFTAITLTSGTVAVY